MLSEPLPDRGARWCVAGEYATESVDASVAKPPRLFQVSDVTGNLVVEEVNNFAQEDLIDEDCMLLDTFNQVFVWVGSRSTEREKRESMEIAQKYVAAATDGRDPDTPIIRVRPCSAALPVWLRRLHRLRGCFTASPSWLRRLRHLRRCVAARL